VQKFKNPDPVSDPVHAHSSPTLVQLEGPEQEADQVSVLVQMALGLQGLKLVMVMTEE